MERIHSENTDPLKNLHSVSGNGGAKQNVSETLYSDQLNFEERLHTQSQNENSFQSEVFHNNQNTRSQNQNQNAFLHHNEFINEDQNVFLSQNQDQIKRQAHNQNLNNAKLLIRPQNNFPDPNSNFDNFQVQNQNLNNAKLQIRPQNNFQSHHENQNNFANLHRNHDNTHVQIQKHNNLQTQILNQNNFSQNQDGNNFQNQNLNLFNSQLHFQNNATQNRNHNSFPNQQQDDFLNPNQNQNNSSLKLKIQDQNNLLNQNNFQPEFQNQKSVDQSQDQNSFQSQIQNPSQKTQNQNNFLSLNQGQNNSQFPTRNQNNFSNQSQNNFQFQTQNQSNSVNQNQNQSKFKSEIQNQKRFLNPNHQTNFQSQIQNDFLNHAQNQNNFLNQNQDHSNSQSPTQHWNNFLIQNQDQNNSKLPIQNQDTFLNQNQDQNNFQFPIQNQINFLSQNIDQHNFQSQSQNQTSLSSKHFGKALLQTFSQQDEHSRNNDSSLLNQINDDLQKSNKTEFQNQSFPGESIAENPLTTHSDQVFFGQSSFENSPTSHNIQNSFSHNVDGIFDSINVKDILHSDAKNPQTNFHSISSHSNFGPSDIHSNTDSNIQSKLAPLVVTSDSTSQTIQNNVDASDIHSIMNAQFHQTTFQPIVSNIGSNENRDFRSQNLEVFDSELKYLQSGLFQPPIREFAHFESNNNQHNTDFQNQSNSPTVPSSLIHQIFTVIFLQTIFKANKQLIAILVHYIIKEIPSIKTWGKLSLYWRICKTDHLINKLWRTPKKGNLKGHNSDTQNMENLDFIHPLNTQGIPDSPNIQGHFNSDVQSNPNIQTLQINLTNNSESKNIQQNLHSQNLQINSDIPISPFNSQNLQNNKSILGNIGTQNRQRNFESQNEGRTLSESEDSEFRSSNLGNVDSELEYLQSGVFQPPLREFNHFQPKNIQSNFDFQTPNSSDSRNIRNDLNSHNIQSNVQLLSHQSNSDSQIAPDAFSLPKRLDFNSDIFSSNLHSENIQSNHESQNMQTNFDSKNIQHDLDSQNTQRNHDSKNIRSNSDSQSIQSSLASQNIQNNIGPHNIHSNLDLQTIQSNFEVQTQEKGFSEVHSDKQQNLRHSDTINLENDHFNFENQENTGSQLFIPGFFHSQNSNNHFDSHSIQGSQNTQANSDDQIKQNIFNLRFTSQNLGKSLSDTKNFPNGSPEPQNMENAGNLQNNNFLSQNLDNSNFQSQNLENHFQSQNLENHNFNSQNEENNDFQSQNLENHFQSQNQRNNYFQSQILDDVEPEFIHLLSGRLQPPTRDFNYLESYGGQNNSDTQNFQNNFNLEYTLDAQKSQSNTDPQNRGKLLSQHSERNNFHDISAEQQNLGNTSSDDLEKSQNLEILQSEHEHPQRVFLRPPFREYNYFESQNPANGVLQSEDFKSEPKIQFTTNLSSQNPRNVEFASQSQQPEHFTPQNLKRSPPVSQNQGNEVFETQNQERNDFLSVNSGVQNGHSGHIPSTSLLNGHQKPQVMAAVDNEDSQIQRFENLERPRNSPSNWTRVQDKEKHIPEPRAQEIISNPETQDAQEAKNSKTSQLQTQSVHTTQQNNNVHIQVMENHDNEAHVLNENSTGLRSLKTVHIQSPTQFFNSFEPMRLQNGNNWRSNRDNLSPQIQTTNLQVESENAESVDLISQNLQSDFQSKNLQSSTNSEVRPSIQLNGLLLPHNTHHDLLSHASQPEGNAGNSLVMKNDQLPSQGSQRGQLRLQSQNNQTDDQLHLPSHHEQLQQHNQRGQLQPQSQNNQLQAQIDQDIPFPLPDQQSDQPRAQRDPLYSQPHTKSRAEYTQPQNNTIQSQNYTQELQHQLPQTNSQSHEHSRSLRRIMGTLAGPVSTGGYTAGGPLETPLEDPVVLGKGKLTETLEALLGRTMKIATHFCDRMKPNLCGEKIEI
ncbi:putative uncharacterized protein DDB_G0282133 [Penaeus monodon]|uniref:putative uncharacterized protein DDB_G0282133 n=1 Tax=Penaeus monodon TaxID=6687 RepID=UPI0018A71E3C|nr:putative uncharacterized protein DDB_G0282133 [Penaeus monodon]